MASGIPGASPAPRARSRAPSFPSGTTRNPVTSPPSGSRRYSCRPSECTSSGSLSSRRGGAWDDDALYLAVEVTKRDVCFRPPDAPPLRLANDPADVHSGGLHLYPRHPEGGDVARILVST